MNLDVSPTGQAYAVAARAYRERERRRATGEKPSCPVCGHTLSVYRVDAGMCFRCEDAKRAEREARHEERKRRRKGGGRKRRKGNNKKPVVVVSAEQMRELRGNILAAKIATPDVLREMSRATGATFSSVRSRMVRDCLTPDQHRAANAYVRKMMPTAWRRRPATEREMREAKELRRSRGVEFDEIARKLGVTKWVIRNLENRGTKMDFGTYLDIVDAILEISSEREAG